MLRSNFPVLKVADDARKYVRDSYLAADKYAQYLFDRKVREEDIANLSLVITEEMVAQDATAMFTPRYYPGNGDSDYIRFSPSKLLRYGEIEQTRHGRNLQGMLFRHETEHFIRQLAGLGAEIMVSFLNKVIG